VSSPGPRLAWDVRIRATGGIVGQDRLPPEVRTKALSQLGRSVMEFAFRTFRDRFTRQAGPRGPWPQRSGVSGALAVGLTAIRGIRRVNAARRRQQLPELPLEVTDWRVRLVRRRSSRRYGSRIVVSHATDSTVRLRLRVPRVSDRGGVLSRVGPLLRDRGRLMASLTQPSHSDGIRELAVLGGGSVSVRVGTKVSYAPIHEFGATIPLTKRQRGLLKKAYHLATGDTSWGLRRGKTALVIPPRPFLEMGPSDMQELRKIVESWVQQWIAKQALPGEVANTLGIQFKFDLVDALGLPLTETSRVGGVLTIR